MIVNEAAVVDGQSTRFLDSGADLTPHVDRERFFHVGWLSSTFSCYATACESTDVVDLLAQINHRVEVAEAARRKARNIAEVSAKTGRRGKRPVYRDVHHYRQRFFRGRHHAAFTIAHGLKLFLNENPRATLGECLAIIKRHVDDSIRWTRQSGYDETSFNSCPPWMSEQSGRSAVEQ